MNKELSTTEQLNAAKDCLIRNDAVFPTGDLYCFDVVNNEWGIVSRAIFTENGEDPGITAWRQNTYEDIKNEI